MRALFPFSAVIGQAEAKLALRLCLIDPHIGGVLLLGQKGSAKSVLARSAAALLPELPFLTLPQGVSEENLLGFVRLEQLVQKGRRAFEPGLLAKVHGGILYIDEINLLPPSIVSLILDVACSGLLRIEREGFSLVQPCRFSIIASMNPEEGGLGTQLLDRFGLSVNLRGLDSTEERIHVLQRVLAWSAEPGCFCRAWEHEELAETQAILAARAALAAVSWSPGLGRRCAALAAAWASQGSRGELSLLRAACVLAAYRGRDHLRLEDIETIAPLAFGHRRGVAGLPQPEGSSDIEPAKPEERQAGPETTQTADSPNGAHPLQDQALDQSSVEQRSADNQGTAKTKQPVQDPSSAEKMEKYEAPQMPPSTLVWSDDRVKRKNKSALSPGKRAVIVDQAGRGRAIRDIRPKEYHGRIAFTASIRAALLARPVLPVRLKPQDIRIQLRERGLGEELLFVVDASGSMGAHHRMAFVKGALLDLLKDSYRKRDSVGLLVFKDSQAELVVPPTRSLHKVYTTLANLRTGGKTPLEEALKKTAVHVLGRHAKEPASRTRVILVSDGRVPKAAESSCLSLAESMAALPARYLVIDNEHGWAGIGTGKKLANALRAEYRHLEELLL